MVKSQFIKDILTLLLDGDEAVETIKQIDFLTESKIDYTGVGAFISFKQDTGIEEFKATKSDLILNGVIITSPILKTGADTTLFFKNGIIDYLEIWSFDGEYPQMELKEYELKQEWAGSAKREI